VPGLGAQRQGSPASWPPPSAGMPPMRRPRRAALIASMRTFAARPSWVEASATGLVGPKPMGTRRSQATPVGDPVGDQPAGDGEGASLAERLLGGVALDADQAHRLLGAEVVEQVVKGGVGGGRLALFVASGRKYHPRQNARVRGIAADQRAGGVRVGVRSVCGPSLVVRRLTARSVARRPLGAGTTRSSLPGSLACVDIRRRCEATFGRPERR
jgi:hypothetical protein